MSAYTVSVIIPVRNGQATLTRAINSALNQTYPVHEILVVDDGSTDSSAQIAQSYGRRVNYISTGGNYGPSVARNIGLLYSKDSHVQFLDADDRLLSQKVEACIGSLASASKPIVPFTAKSFRTGDAPITALARRVGKRITDSLPERVWRRYPSEWDESNQLVSVLTFPIGTPGPLHSRQALLDAGGFNEELLNGEDIELHCRLVLKGTRFRLIDIELVECDLTGSGHLRNSSTAARHRVRADLAIAYECQRAGELGDRVAQVLADRLAYAARKAMEAGFVHDGREALVLAHELARKPRFSRLGVYDTLYRLKLCSRRHVLPAGAKLLKEDDTEGTK